MVAKSGLSLLLAVAALGAFTPASALADNWAGIDLGVNFSDDTNQDSATSGDTEFQGGILANWGLGNIWYLQTAIRYNSYGVTASESESGLTVNASAVAHYIEIPVLIKPTFDAGVLLPYVLAGPMVGFRSGSSASATLGAVSVAIDTGGVFKSVDFSMDLGAGAEFPVAPGFRAFLQFEYSYGLINTINTDTAKTRGAILSAGASLGF